MGTMAKRKTAGWGTLGPEGDALELRALRDENASLRALLQEGSSGGEPRSWIATVPVGLLLLDPAGCVIEANRVAARILDVPDASLRGTPLARLVEARDRATLLRHLRAALIRREPVACQVSFVRGDRVPFVGYVQSLATGGKEGRRVTTVISSASERYLEERAQADRLAEERRIHAVVEAAERRFDRVAALGALVSESLDLADTAARAARVSLPDLASFSAIDVADDRGRVRRLASACAEGSPAVSIDPYAPRGSAAVIRTGRAEIMLRVTQGDLVGLSAEPADFTRLSGKVRAYLCLPLRAHGRTLGAMTFVRTRGQSFDDDDVLLAEEMARQVAAVMRGALLYQAAQEAERKKDEFLAMLGHELRNPLAAIVLAGHRLRLAGDPSVKKAADIVGRQSQRLTRLVDDLLDVSRVSRGQIKLVRARLDLGEVIAAAVESVRPVILARRHEIAVHLPPDPLVLDGDAARLEQVLVNLLGNASRYTEPGGHIHVDASREGSDAVVRVRDDGIGMDRDTISGIFDPFTRFAPSFDRGDRGLGIGLTLSRALVELHGGRITAESAGPGQGSELTVRLPVDHAAAGEPVAPGRDVPCHVNGKPSRWLLVEDEPDVAEMTRERLAGMGLQVRVARDGVEAVDAALAFHPQLLLVDLGLPGMSGYDVVRRLKKEAALSGATFVALSGYGDDATRRRSLEAGFDRHLTKPLAEEALSELLGEPG